MLQIGRPIVEFFVVVACPITGREVPTGIVTDITSFANLPKGDAQFSCPACGQSHKWTRSDARLAHSLASLDDTLPAQNRSQGQPPTSNCRADADARQIEKNDFASMTGDDQRDAPRGSRFKLLQPAIQDAGIETSPA
jgi:hypothetical protein